MTSEADAIWPRLVDALRASRPAVRVKGSRDVEPTKWEPWILVPSPTYLETGTLGPVPFREIEWVEVDPSRRNDRGRLVAAEPGSWRDSLLAAIEGAGLAFTIVDDKLRFVAART